jgi:hypothetical protein
MLSPSLVLSGTSPVSPTLQECIDQAATHGGEPPTCTEVEGGYVASWPGGFDGGTMSGEGGGDFGALFGFAIVMALLIGVVTVAWKISTARRLAAASGMDPAVATQMAVFTDDGLEATYLASNLRRSSDAASGPDPQSDTAPVVATVRERLAELKSLLDDGSITLAEHDERRRAILDSL